MTSNALKYQARLQEWTAAIQECRGSGLPVKQWCRNHGITTTTYYRWERELLVLTGGTRNKPHPAGTTTFAELPIPRQQCRTVSERSATIHINDAAIDIYAECFDLRDYVTVAGFGTHVLSGSDLGSEFLGMIDSWISAIGAIVN